MHDLVIRGGVVADGSGGALREADVAIDGGRITTVGKVAAGAGREEIDAKGLLVTPGFVDVHTHYDGQATWDQRMQPSSWHGVTTVVMGNCGVGFAPVRPDDRGRLIRLMEGVEDIPGVALEAGLPWSWESFPEYLDHLARGQYDMDLCAQLPHAALRVFAMGERATRLEPATSEDISRMRALTAEAMRAGAAGFSTSRTLNHRSRDGAPTPSLRAEEDELRGIAEGMASAGSGVIQLISDFNQPDMASEFAMIRRIAEVAGRPVSISVAQVHTEPEGWRDLLDFVDGAVEDGIEMRAQVAPRAIGMIFGLQASLHPFVFHPSYLPLADATFSEKLAAFRDSAFRARLLQEQTTRRQGARYTDFERIYPLGNPPDYEPPPERSVAALAAAAGKSPEEFAYDLLLEDDGRNLLLASFANFAHLNLDACGEMIGRSNTIVGLGDGGAHVGIISDASFGTYLLSHWGRDRARGRFPIERLVRKLSWDTAQAVGLQDRGRLSPGLKADLNIIDVDRLRLAAPEIVGDLPAGGRRLLQRADGYVATIVSGQVTYRNGEATASLPGRLVRRYAS